MPFDSGFNSGFGIMSTLFPIFFTLIFLLVFGTIVFNILKGIFRWNHNNQQPVLTVEATIKSKRTNTSHHHHDASSDNFHHHSSSTSYYVTFEVESGDRMEYQLSGDEYGMLAEGDTGKLTFQGTRYHGFKRSY